MDGTKERQTSTANTSFFAVGLDMAVKLDFDLNEGFPSDDGSQRELVKSSTPGYSSAVHVPCPVPVPIFVVSKSFPASISVVAAVKGSFIPPESLLRTKAELGWKGSAATSAFWPPKPRKVLEMPLNTTYVPLIDNRVLKVSILWTST